MKNCFQTVKTISFTACLYLHDSILFALMLFAHENSKNKINRNFIIFFLLFSMEKLFNFIILCFCR